MGEHREKLEPLTAEEKQYEHKLSQLSTFALGPDWKDFWPEHLEQTRPIGYISEYGPFGSLEGFIQQTNDNVTGPEAVCFVENVTLPWAIRLGAAWDLDPNFFISHVRPLTDEEAKQMLKDCMVPNSKCGIKSYREKQWATVRGYVDWGKPRRALTSSDLEDSTKRRHECSVFQTRQSHTNMSFYHISQCFHLVFIDQIPDYQYEFVLEHLHWFPNQTILRLGAVDCPVHITIPQLGLTRLTAVFPICNLFNDDTDKQILLQCLEKDDINDFLYKACLFWCEREIRHISFDIDEINDRQAAGRAVAVNESLPNIQKVSSRPKSCIVENRAFEYKLARAASVDTASYPPRKDFDKLAVRFSEVDNAVVQCFYRQMTTLTAAGTQENLRQTAATNKQAQAAYEQTRSMTALSWVAFVYAPLTFVTGIFGMNCQEIDHQSPLSWTLSALIAVAFLSVTVFLAKVYRRFQKHKADKLLETQNGNQRVRSKWFRCFGAPNKDASGSHDV